MTSPRVILDTNIELICKENIPREVAFIDEKMKELKDHFYELQERRSTLSQLAEVLNIPLDYDKRNVSSDSVESVSVSSVDADGYHTPTKQTVDSATTTIRNSSNPFA